MNYFVLSNKMIILGFGDVIGCYNLVLEFKKPEITVLPSWKENGSTYFASVIFQFKKLLRLSLSNANIWLESCIKIYFTYLPKQIVKMDKINVQLVIDKYAWNYYK